MKRVKKRLIIFCEGKTEQNYIANLFRIKKISENYCSSPKVLGSSLLNATKKNTEHKDYTAFIYDADKIKEAKKYRENFNPHCNIFLTENKFEDFLDLHPFYPYYKKKRKSHFDLNFLQGTLSLGEQDFARMDNDKIRYDGFKTIIDFILDLFRKEI